MHIPDGYLSPATCATLYAVAAPFWYVALKRVKRALNTRLVPLISVFAAFSFVVMMFNLPLPGGTTGHAVGMGIAAIVLGPWASILAISIALFIQAIFFGDGGITAIGANCVNMGIVGPLVAYGVYRLLGAKAGLTSKRRVFAAALGGYAGINAAALLAAVEFGIQPLLFHDATGTPLYAPYPLSISVPAMMIGHLTFAGLAELVITAGVVAYLQRADTGMLRLTAPDAPLTERPDEATTAIAWPTTRKLWLGLATLLILTPLGILAVGSAWGEWTANDFADVSARQQMAAASGNRMPPTHVPQGFERLSSLWTAPLSRYAPPLIRSASFGYLVSAAVGVGLIIVCCVIFNWVLSRGRRGAWHTPRSRRFVERTVAGLLSAAEHSLYAEHTARGSGFLQQLDPRAKLCGLLGLIVAVATAHRIWVLIALFVVALVLALMSRVSILALMSRVWIGVLTFTGAIALPAIFLTPGNPIYRLPLLGWAVTAQGLQSAIFLLLRAEIAATLSLLLILCTPWVQVLKSLRFFHVPAVCVVLLGMTYRYIFLLLQTAHDMFEARRGRLVGQLDGPERRRLAAGSAGVLLGRSVQLANDVHLAMRARGYVGEIYILENLRMGSADWVHLSALLGIAAVALWLGR